MTIPSIIAEKLRAALAGISDVTPQVTVAKDAQFGDYATSVAMTLAKQQRANPQQLAQQIIDQLDVAEMCERPTIAGAGFINFRLKPAWLEQRVAQLSKDARLGVPLPAQPLQLVIDFSGPNVAKPMHVGHIRSTILGDALARIAEFIGHRVVRDNHIGDWGKQFGMLLVGWKAQVGETGSAPATIEELEQLYRGMNARIEKEKSGEIDAPGERGWIGVGHEEKTVSARVSEELVKLQNGDSENLGIWNEMTRISKNEFASIYQRLDVRFSETLGESFYNPWLKDVVQQLVEGGIARESDGALCVFSDGIGKPEDDPFLIKDQDGWRDNPALVQKSDGAANYTTTDLATLQYRMKTWAPDAIVYVTDGRQQLHFQQLFAIYRRWQPELVANIRLAHVWFGSILGENGKPFKTRSGDTIKLADLLDEAVERALALVAEKNPELPDRDRREIARVVGLGAVKYADLLPNRQSNYIFSWEKMLSFQGNTAPYLQYSIVRIRSIFRKAEGARAGTSVTLAEPAELALAKKLLKFGEVLPQVLDDYRPNQLANYLYELASTFHSFFEACPVLRAEPATRDSRLLLCELSARVLKQGLALLGIEAPERM